MDHIKARAPAVATAEAPKNARPGSHCDKEYNPPSAPAQAPRYLGRWAHCGTRTWRLSDREAAGARCVGNVRRVGKVWRSAISVLLRFAWRSQGAATASLPAGPGRYVGRHVLMDAAPDSWGNDPRVASVTRRKEGTVDVRLTDFDTPITMKTTELLNYPKFRARVFDVTGHMYGPMSREDWEWVLHSWQHSGDR
jgi:hypothetical protein